MLLTSCGASALPSRPPDELLSAFRTDSSVTLPRKASRCPEAPVFWLPSDSEGCSQHSIWETSGGWGLDTILSFKNIQGGTSLRIQWIRIRLPMQRTQIRSLVWEDFTCCGATKPVHSNEDPAQPEKEKQNKNFWFQSTPTRPTQLANTPPATSWPEEGCQGAYRVAPITLRAVSFLFLFLQPMMWKIHTYSSKSTAFFPNC